LIGIGAFVALKILPTPVETALADCQDCRYKFVEKLHFIEQRDRAGTLRENRCFLIVGKRKVCLRFSLWRRALVQNWD